MLNKFLLKTKQKKAIVLLLFIVVSFIFVKNIKAFSFTDIENASDVSSNVVSQKIDAGKYNLEKVKIKEKYKSNKYILKIKELTKQLQLKTAQYNEKMKITFQTMPPLQENIDNLASILVEIYTTQLNILENVEVFLIEELKDEKIKTGVLKDIREVKLILQDWISSIRSGQTPIKEWREDLADKIWHVFLDVIEEKSDTNKKEQADVNKPKEINKPNEVHPKNKEVKKLKNEIDSLKEFNKKYPNIKLEGDWPSDAITNLDAILDKMPTNLKNSINAIERLSLAEFNNKFGENILGHADSTGRITLAEGKSNENVLIHEAAHAFTYKLNGYNNGFSSKWGEAYDKAFAFSKVAVETLSGKESSFHSEWRKAAGDYKYGEGIKTNSAGFDVWSSDGTNGMRNGMMRPYSAKTIDEDIATFVAEVSTGNSNVLKNIIGSDSRYESKLNTAYRFGFISESKFNEFNPQGLKLTP